MANYSFLPELGTFSFVWPEFDFLDALGNSSMRSPIGPLRILGEVNFGIGEFVHETEASSLSDGSFANCLTIRVGREPLSF